MEKERRKQLGITLTSETLERLEIICDELGLAKSHAISMMINRYWLDNMTEIEMTRDEKLALEQIINDDSLEEDF